MTEPASAIDMEVIDRILASGTVPEELRIRLSPEALREAECMAVQPDYLGMSLRIYLEGKGCDGFFYGVTFAVATPDDLHFPHGSIDVVVDPQSLRFLLGSTVTWVDDERGRGFLVDNPEHRRFRGKFFKRKAWQEKLTEKPPASVPAS